MRSTFGAALYFKIRKEKFVLWNIQIIQLELFNDRNAYL